MYLKSQNSFLAALYMRLSKDDGDKVESDSIKKQRTDSGRLTRNLQRLCGWSLNWR